MGGRPQPLLSLALLTQALAAVGLRRGAVRQAGWLEQAASTRFRGFAGGVASLEVRQRVLPIGSKVGGRTRLDGVLLGFRRQI